MRTISLIMLAVLTSGWPQKSWAQAEPHRFEAAAQLTSAISSEFNQSDIGIGGRLAWLPAPLLGVEAEVGVFPRDFPDRPFSRSRVEGLFGATVGPRLGRLRPFARVRPGFLSFREAPGPVVCILIFPPPLSCQLAAGRTVLALDIGGGLELFPRSRILVRVDAGDRLLRYPVPTLDASGVARAESFFSHDFRFAIGGGLRF